MVEYRAPGGSPVPQIIIDTTVAREAYSRGLQQRRDYLVEKWPNDGLVKWENRPHEIKECK